LEAQPIKPPKQQFGLFETTLRNPHQLSETLARLTALLGADRVGTPVLEETHRPDAFHLEPFEWNFTADIGGPSSSPSPRREKGSPLPLGEGGGEGNQVVQTVSKLSAALRRFRPVAPVSVSISENWHLQSEKIRGNVVDQCGPYLISGNWWDEKLWERAEWDLQLGNGSLVRAHKSEGTWKIDGVYD
jgi:protein ImuB